MTIALDAVRARQERARAEAPDTDGWAEHNAISLGPLDKIVHQRAEAILWSRIFAYLRSTKRT